VCLPGYDDSDAWLQPKIVLLDVGMVTRLSDTDQHNMLDLFRSLSGMDGQGIANAVLQFSGQLASASHCSCSVYVGLVWTPIHCWRHHLVCADQHSSLQLRLEPVGV